jgi:hypothetical protein
MTSNEERVPLVPPWFSYRVESEAAKVTDDVLSELIAIRAMFARVPVQKGFLGTTNNS